MNTQALLIQARAAYAPLISDLRSMGRTTAQIKGYIAGLLVCVCRMPRVLAIVVAHGIVGA